MRIIDPGAKAKFIDDAIASQTDDCIIWPHCTDDNGYPIRQVKGKLTKVHITVCTAANGERPSLCHAAHKCGHASCINPRHVYWATPLENSADRIRHGRSGKKVSACDAHNIRETYASGGVTQAALAAFFAIHPSTVSQIINNQRWCHAIGAV